MKTVGHITIPYMKGISESIKNINRKKGIQVHFKPSQTVRKVLVHPKDKDDKDKKSGVIYKVTCGDSNCNEIYVGETGRTLGERASEHQKAPSALHSHHLSKGHSLPSMDQVSILSREGHKFLRFIKESIFIRLLSPSLNRNIGKYELPHIWDNAIKNDFNLKKIASSLVN